MLLVLNMALPYPILRGLSSVRRSTPRRLRGSVARPGVSSPVDSRPSCTYKRHTSTPRQPWTPRTDMHLQEGEEGMKFGINFQLQTPKPLDAEQWHEHDELKI